MIMILLLERNILFTWPGGEGFGGNNNLIFWNVGEWDKWGWFWGGVRNEEAERVWEIGLKCLDSGWWVVDGRMG